MIKKTAEELNCSGQVRIHKQEALHFLKENPGTYYDMIFADPPYDFDKYDELINNIRVNSFGIFVLEYSILEKPVMESEGYTVIDKKAGITNFKIFITK